MEDKKKRSEETIERIVEFYKSKNMSQSQFANEIGMHQKTLNNYILGTSCSVPLRLVELTLEAFPALSAEWLLRGTGDMYGKESTNDENTDIRRLQTTIDNLNFALEQLRYQAKK